MADDTALRIAAVVTLLVGPLWVAAMLHILGLAPMWLRRITCKWLEWHDGEGGTQGFDGASMTGTCSICGCRVLRDSQGGWFRAGPRPNNSGAG